MSRTKKNVIPTVNPTVGMILMPKFRKGHCKPGRIAAIAEEIDSIQVQRASGTYTMKFETMNEKYRVATTAEAVAFNAAVPAYDAERVEPALSSEPSVPRPTVAHEPPPPAPEPAANDTEVTALAKVFSSTLETIAKQQEDAAKLHRESLESMERRFEQRMERQDARFMSMLREIAVDARKQQEPAPPPVPSAPVPTAVDAHDAALVRRHTAMFEHLVPEFVSKCLVLVDLRDPAQRARALEANEVHKMFVKWCADGKRADETPYEHAFYALLKKIPNAKHREDVKRGDKKRVLTPWAAKDTRQVEMFPDQTEAPAPAKASPAAGAKSVLIALDAVEVGRFAKENLWPDLDRKYTETISGLLKSGFTKGEMVDALKALVSLIKGGGSDYVYTPDEILEPTTFRDLVTYARRAK